jgi:hypothetical protein
VNSEVSCLTFEPDSRGALTVSARSVENCLSAC